MYEGYTRLRSDLERVLNSNLTISGRAAESLYGCPELVVLSRSFSALVRIHQHSLLTALNHDIRQNSETSFVRAAPSGEIPGVECRFDMRETHSRQRTQHTFVQYSVWICQILQEISQKRTRERMSDQEAKEIKSRSQRDRASAFYSQLQLTYNQGERRDWRAKIEARRRIEKMGLAQAWGFWNWMADMFSMGLFLDAVGQLIGTVPSQTVTNPREHVNAITTRSGKTCEGPSTPLVPTPIVSIPSNELEQNLETSMDKVQKPSSKEYRTKDWIERCSRRNAKVQQMVKLIAKEQREARGHRYHNQLDRTSALADSGASTNLLPHSIYKQLGLEALTPTHPRSAYYFRKEPFLRTAKALIDLYEETLTLRVGKKNSFADELTLSKNDVQEGNFQDHSNPLFEFDDNFKSSTINPLFDEMEEDSYELPNLDHQDDPSIPRPPPEPPDVEKCFEPEA
ncbi:hypothetical protein Tco_0630938, partial [Tanacetum coccineum]